MERFLYALGDVGTFILIALIVALIIKIVYWISLATSIGEIEDRTRNIDKNFSEVGNTIIEQNKAIITNQEKIIELLQNKKEE